MWLGLQKVRQVRQLALSQFLSFKLGFSALDRVFFFFLSVILTAIQIPAINDAIVYHVDKY